jgi:uncharacterized protein (DUF983 family)
MGEMRIPPAPSFLTGLKRGVLHRCPNCGEGRLYSRYLKVDLDCEVCGHDLARYPADDGPAYFTILIIGHLFVAPLLFFPIIWKAPPIFVPYGPTSCARPRTRPRHRSEPTSGAAHSSSRHRDRGRRQVVLPGRLSMLGTILIIVLILALIGALPTWGHSRSWGYFPSGGLGLILVILIVLVLMGRL